MNTTLAQQHLFLSSGQDINDICKPLHNIGITQFTFVKTFKDATQINLCSNPDWLAHYFDMNFHHVGCFEGFFDWFETGYTLWSTVKDQTIFADAKEYYNLGNGITITRKFDDACEFYYFGAIANNYQIINFYLNNIDLLNRFISYFKDKAKNIIASAIKSKIIIANNQDMIKLQLQKAEQLAIFNKKKALLTQFIKETDAKNYYLFDNCKEIRLTKREKECLLNIISDESADETAKKLFISRRTVEKHLENIKLKFECRNKHGLLQKILKGKILF